MTTKTEDEYFARIEASKKARLTTMLADVDAREEAEQLRTLHRHRCGKCGQAMQTTHYKGVEIEVCPACGAVLLDPGELQQLAGEERHGILTAVAHVFGFTKD
jgi:rubrerythrin